MTEEFLFIGGKPTAPFVRLVADHIEKLMPGADDVGGVDYRKNFMNRITAMLEPHFKGHEGLRWEIHFTQVPTDLWLVQGIVPPVHGSEEEKRWMEADKVLAREPET